MYNISYAYNIMFYISYMYLFCYFSSAIVTCHLFYNVYAVRDITLYLNNSNVKYVYKMSDENKLN